MVNVLVELGLGVHVDPGSRLVGRELGGGTPYLPPVAEDLALDLIETRTFGSRVIYERYGRERPDPPTR